MRNFIEMAGVLMCIFALLTIILFTICNLIFFKKGFREEGYRTSPEVTFSGGENASFLGRSFCLKENSLIVLTHTYWDKDTPMAVCTLTEEGFVIYVNRGFYSLSRGQQQQVLAHEIGHWQSGYFSREDHDYLLEEVLADQWAARHGYNPVGVLKKILAERGSQMDRAAREALAFRIKLLEQKEEK